MKFLIISVTLIVAIFATMASAQQVVDEFALLDTVAPGEYAIHQPESFLTGSSGGKTSLKNGQVNFLTINQIFNFNFYSFNFKDLSEISVNTVVVDSAAVVEGLEEDTEVVEESEEVDTVDVDLVGGLVVMAEVVSVVEMVGMEAASVVLEGGSAAVAIMEGASVGVLLDTDVRKLILKKFVR